MRVLVLITCLLRNLVAISLFASVLTSAYPGTFLHSLPSNLLRRSLPASLATAPLGAVGYQPPPGPVHRPTTTTTIPAGATAFSQKLSENGGIGDASSEKNVIVLVGTATKNQAVLQATQTAMAGRSTTLESNLVVLSVVLCLFIS
ncbi:uncharacterized protein BO95DRAFT_458091 [Aspergillus brunneoviolaceus CBS 621.78]|uniref:Uncharacterized protein n=1 Tax=Aspergillus brunneoviolaceus CBS 621.78 TaxID=1450534 RepID=A0ACD1GPN7_9EURO|nr:hypothetical protein BO95DRAFT_458091 [Aspergillus brunneoviolaceus CBS 621.78]RAH51330.1 hypothetical protein BO95DRAFT_458091 [Aspergillus brunneoviolaceus CBS 621.78]